jgi:hypothetical protein
VRGLKTIRFRIGPRLTRGGYRGLNAHALSAGAATMSETGTRVTPPTVPPRCRRAEDQD